MSDKNTPQTDSLDNNPDNQALLRALNDTVPQAERAFRDNLEEQLMSRLSGDTSAMNGDEKIMRSNNKSKQKRNTQSSRVPLTLVAAILAIVVVGGIFAVVQQSSIFATQQDCGYDGDLVRYTVRPGDTLFSLSHLFDVSVPTLREINCTTELNDLIVGSAIRIPQENVNMAATEIAFVTATPDPVDLTATAILNQATVEVLMAEFNEPCEYNGSYILHETDVNETIFRLSRDYDVLTQDILEANCIDQVRTLRVGDLIRIPVPEVSGQVSNPRNVIVAAKDIAYGETITIDMLEVVSRTPRTIDAVFPFCCTDYIVGRTAAEPMNEGVIIEERMLSDWESDEVQMLEVVTVSEFVASGAEITNDLVTISLYPIHLVPNGSFAEDRFVIGQYATTDMYEGEIVFFDRLSQEPVPPTGDNPLVIATRDIALNDVITEEMITTIYVSDDYMHALQPPERSYMSIISSPELAVGQVANTFIPQFSPVRMETLSSGDDCPNTPMGTCSAYMLAEGKVAVAIPVDTHSSLQLGQQVDVLAALPFVETDADDGTQPEIMIRNAATNATFIMIEVDRDTMIATVAVSPQEAEELTYLAEASIPMRLILHAEQSNTTP